MNPREVAIVTGAGSGIGKATAKVFADRGYGVVAVDLTAESLAWTATESDPSRYVALAGSVTSEALNKEAVAAAVETFGRLDVSILNAGITGSRPWNEDGAIDALRRILDVNVVGVAIGINEAAAVMKKQGSGVILPTCSTSGLRGDPGSWAYNASKAAVINLVRAAALDLGPFGIRINGVAPGPTETGLTARLNDMPELKRGMVNRIPLGRWGQPEDLAEVFFFLASRAASFITGDTIFCDGGISANAGHFALPERPR
ncbi:MAG: glucose 1-dehydrogenase [Actinobacteria bacterium]|nr:glucose 1-dehydrogenase [Actinomycetota bacterium]NBP53338.1 glucose 1-dehydrogenase [Actinomycetota bacterium]